jgi:hypothetical protein
MKVQPDTRKQTPPRTQLGNNTSKRHLTSKWIERAVTQHPTESPEFFALDATPWDQYFIIMLCKAEPDQWVH